jgi:glutathione S-transferase
MIREVLQNLPDRRRELLRRELGLLDRRIEKVYLLAEDLTRARIALPAHKV